MRQSVVAIVSLAIISAVPAASAAPGDNPGEVCWQGATQLQAAGGCADGHFTPTLVQVSPYGEHQYRWDVLVFLSGLATCGSASIEGATSSGCTFAGGGTGNPAYSYVWYAPGSHDIPWTVCVWSVAGTHANCIYGYYAIRVSATAGDPSVENIVADVEMVTLGTIDFVIKNGQAITSWTLDELP